MFSLDQLNDLHDRLGAAETPLEYVRALDALGVETYDSYIVDGHSEYVGAHDHTVISPPVHDKLSIAEVSLGEDFLRHLGLHEQGRTSYMEMSKGLADSGIEEWTVDTNNATMTFSDQAGNDLLVETIT
jgi:uncharacterized protein YbcV (DUF1398 family)